MKKYKVRCEYRGSVTVEVEAENERDAEVAGIEEADAAICRNLNLWDTNVNELKVE